jgi:hypothetical protein
MRLNSQISITYILWGFLCDVYKPNVVAGKILYEISGGEGKERKFWKKVKIALFLIKCNRSS